MDWETYFKQTLTHYRTIKEEIEDLEKHLAFCRAKKEIDLDSQILLVKKNEVLRLNRRYLLSDFRLASNPIYGFVFVKGKNKIPDKVTIVMKFLDYSLLDYGLLIRPIGNVHLFTEIVREILTVSADEKEKFQKLSEATKKPLSLAEFIWSEGLIFSKKYLSDKSVLEKLEKGFFLQIGLSIIQIKKSILDETISIKEI